MAYLTKKPSMRLMLLLLFALMAAVPSGYALETPPNPAVAYQDTETAPESALITGISAFEDDQGTIVTITGSRTLTFTSVKQADPEGVVFYFPNTGLGRSMAREISAAGIVSGIESSELATDKRTVRVVVHLARESAYTVNTGETALEVVFPTVTATADASPTAPSPAAAMAEPGASYYPEAGTANMISKKATELEEGPAVVRDTMNSSPSPSSKAPVYLASAGQASDADRFSAVAAATGLVNQIDFKSEADGKSVILIGATSVPEYTIEKLADTRLKLTLFNTRLPDYRERPLITTGFESAVNRVVPHTETNLPDQTFFTFELRESVPYFVEQKGALLMVHFEASSIPPKTPAAELTLADRQVVVESAAPQAQPQVAAATAITAMPVQPAETATPSEEAGPVYTGEKIALDFYETDIKNVFRILQTVSGLNFAIDKDVSGQVTLSFDEPVPWDQVLDLILKMNRLGKTMEGNIVRIATLDALKQEESERQAVLLAEQKSKEQELLLEPVRTEYIAVNYSNAKEEVLPHIQNVLSEDRGKADVDERSNLIVITDTDRVIAQAKTIVQRLDRVTPQVVIEARVVEVNSDVSNELGISWSASQDSVYKNALGGTYGWDVAMNYPSSSSDGAIGFEFARVSGTPFVLDAQLNALESESRGKIISAPKIMTMDNKKATIKQGYEVGYLERDDSGGSSVAFKDVDLLLEVTPHVTPDDRVAITVYITKNDIAGYEDGTPTLSTNEAETEFLVNNGETIVIGGILKKTETTGQEGFPVLKDIPGLGWLFQNNTTSSSNQELLIFITPKIVTLEQKVVE